MTEAEVPNYIAVEGPIGVGKTSLAHRLAESLGAELVLEQAEDNPFLERFYLNPRQAALPTQLHFLFQRARQVQGLRQGRLFEARHVADFMLDKDRLFAQVTLDDEERKLYEQVYVQLAPNAPVPELVVYLQAPVEVLLERIGRRGRGYERHIDPLYLRRLADAYTEFFYHYDESPLLIVNVESVDLVHNDQEYQALLEQVRRRRRGRHYFNPVPLGL